MALRGVRLPAGARTLELGVRVRGDDIALRAILETSIGEFDVAELGGTTHKRELRARLPKDSRGVRLVALELDQLPSGRSSLTANAGTGLQPVSQGTLTLGPLRAGNRAVPVDWSSWVGSAAAITPAGQVAHIRFQLTADVTGVQELHGSLTGLLEQVLNPLFVLGTYRRLFPRLRIEFLLAAVALLLRLLLLNRMLHLRQNLLQLVARRLGLLRQLAQVNLDIRQLSKGT